MLATLALAGTARADVTLGSTAVPAGAIGNDCFLGTVITQATDSPGTPFIVPQAGRITQWQINTTDAFEAEPVTFVVLRPAGTSFTVVGVDSRTLPDPLPAGNVATFPLTFLIRVMPGDRLGIWSDGSAVYCYWQAGSVPAASLIGLRAVSQPTSGQTLSQFLPNSGGGFTLNLAANLVPDPMPVTTKKKCRKKKKAKKGAAAAAKKKKKKCKKKRGKKK